MEQTEYSHDAAFYALAAWEHLIEQRRKSTTISSAFADLGRAEMSDRALLFGAYFDEATRDLSVEDYDAPWDMEFVPKVIDQMIETNPRALLMFAKDDVQEAVQLVCHDAAINRVFDQVRAGTLPEGFDQWDWADKDGYTVAHAAAGSGCLPEDFDGWHWADKDGETVLDVAERYGHIKPKRAAEIRASWAANPPEETSDDLGVGQSGKGTTSQMSM